MAALDCERFLLQGNFCSRGNEVHKPFPSSSPTAGRFPDRSKPALYKTGQAENTETLELLPIPCSMGFDAAVTLSERTREERKVSIPATLLILRAQVLTGRCDGRMGILLSIPQSEKSEKGRKSPHILPPFLILGVQILT